MAKTRTVTRTIVARAPSPTIRVVAPSGGGVRRRARHYARRAGRGARGIASEGTLLPVLAAAALGYAKKQGMAIPTILGMGPAGSAGLICWGIGKWGHSPMASKAAVGLLSVAAYSWAKGEGIAGDGRAVVYDDE